MTDYLVTWSVNIDADSPLSAARQALAMQRDLNSTALIFNVGRGDGVSEVVELDLILDQPVSVLVLDAATTSVLSRALPESACIRDVAALTRAQLHDLRGIGWNRASDVEQALKRVGLKLAEEERLTFEQWRERIRHEGGLERTDST